MHHDELARPVVLVVEDEPLLLMMAVDLVENAGFEAIETRNAREAFTVLESRNDIRIIFTDVDMPGGPDGLELAAVVRSRWPPIGVVIVSGHIRPAETNLPDGCIFHSKPYDSRKVTSDLHRIAFH